MVTNVIDGSIVPREQSLPQILLTGFIIAASAPISSKDVEEQPSSDNQVDTDLAVRSPTTYPSHGR